MNTLDKQWKPFLVLVPVIIWIAIVFLPIRLQLWVISGLLLVVIVMLYLFHDHRHRQESVSALREYHQLEALLGIYRQMDGHMALTGLRRFAASPDMLFQVLALIDKHHPKVIVELGSGSSTRLISSYLESKNMDCAFISVEHDETYLELTAADANVQKVQLCHCPLAPFRHEGVTYSWYDVTDLKLPGSIDMLIVDGPPDHLNPLARFPAYPAFRDRLSDQAIIVMDDADRQDEEAIIQKWMEMGSFERIKLPAEKGLTVLKSQNA